MTFNVNDPVRIGRLSKMAQSPAHYLSLRDAEGAHLAKGSALHQHVLLDTPVVVCTVRRDARSKAYQEFLEGSAGHLVLTAKEAEDVRGMAEAIRRHPTARQLLTGVREQTLFWERQGRPCRGTPDAWTPGRITELKTARCTKPGIFERECDRYHYDAQLSWYQYGIKQQPNGPDCPEHWIVGVESAPPYAVTCLQLNFQRRATGDGKCQLWLEKLLVCEESNSWPAYTDAPVEWGVQESYHRDEPTEDDIDDEVLA